MKKATVINIIPSNYDGNPRDALGYPWQVYKEVPGNDITIDPGMDYIAVAKKAMRDLGVTEASVTCMWAGGAANELVTLDDSTTDDSTSVVTGSTMAETGMQVRLAEEADLLDQDNRNAQHHGYCKLCHSYCYGDCQA